MCSIVPTCCGSDSSSSSLGRLARPVHSRTGRGPILSQIVLRRIGRQEPAWCWLSAARSCGRIAHDEQALDWSNWCSGDTSLGQNLIYNINSGQGQLIRHLCLPERAHSLAKDGLQSSLHHRFTTTSTSHDNSYRARN